MAIPESVIQEHKQEGSLSRFFGIMGHEMTRNEMLTCIGYLSKRLQNIEALASMNTLTFESHGRTYP